MDLLPPPDVYDASLTDEPAPVVTEHNAPAYTGPPPPESQLGALPPLLQLSEAEARQALLREVSTHCCWGSKAAKQMAITEIKPSSAYHYKLETFGEARSTAPAHEPYRGGFVDGPEQGPAPQPWNISVPVPELFRNGSAQVEVPHTSVVKPCHRCQGMGNVQCSRCIGSGRTTCHQCMGRGQKSFTDANGHHHTRSCMSCHGSGRDTCSGCRGSGRVQCPLCQGQGRLRTFMKLTVTWTNHVSDYVLETSDLPDHLITGATGQVLFTEQNYLLSPFNSFPVPQVNQASQQMIPDHRSSRPQERILQQRHHVRSVPVSEASFTFDGKAARFWVYGLSNQVHAPDYPQKCCCGCIVS